MYEALSRHKIEYIYLSKSVAFWALILHPFFKPNGIHGISASIASIYDVAMILSFFIITFKFLRGIIKINWNIIIITAFIGWITIVTCLNNGQVFAMARMSLQYISFSIVVKMLADHPKVLIKSVLINLEVLIYLNFICLLLYPHGMYVSSQNGNWNNWLLGYDNQWFIVFFAAMFTAIAYYFLTNNWLRSLMLIAVIHISAAIVMSGVIIFGLAIIDVFYFTGAYKSNLINYVNIWIAAIISNITIVFFSSSGIANFIVYTIFHKTSTSIPARLKIWAISFEAIMKNPLIGYGHQDPMVRTLLYANKHGSNAHNFIIEILYEGGIIGLLLFVALIVYAGVTYHKAKKSDFSRILLVCTLACLVTGAVDSLLESRGLLFFWMISVISNLPQINNALWRKTYN